MYECWIGEGEGAAAGGGFQGLTHRPLLETAAGDNERRLIDSHIHVRVGHALFFMQIAILINILYVYCTCSLAIFNVFYMYVLH